MGFQNTAPEFDYSLGFNPFLGELMFDKDFDFYKEFWEHLQNLKIIHGGKNGCHRKISIKRNDTNLTIHCSCQAIVIYPPREDREHSYMVINKKKGKYGKRD